jgi:hypothetical protein
MTFVNRRKVSRARLSLSVCEKLHNKLRIQLKLSREKGQKLLLELFAVTSSHQLEATQTKQNEKRFFEETSSRRYIQPTRRHADDCQKKPFTRVERERNAT